MSKKLLEESTVRSFMKLANLQPLTDKFIKESYGQEEEGMGSTQPSRSPPSDPRRGNEPPQEGLNEDDDVNLEEELLEEEPTEENAPPTMEEGKESEGRPSTPKPKVKGVAKPVKMDAAKNAPGDAKMKPMKQTHVHSDKPDTIEHNKKSNAPKKNNSQFDIVAESLEEMGDQAPPQGGMPAGQMEEEGSEGETEDHKEKMKGLIRDMLGKLGEMGAEYGLTMEVSDEGGEGEEAAETPEEETGEHASGEEGPEAGEAMMQEKLNKMVEKLTQRVASRLVKESKKKR